MPILSPPRDKRSFRLAIYTIGQVQNAIGKTSIAISKLPSDAGKQREAVKVELQRCAQALTWIAEKIKRDAMAAGNLDAQAPAYADLLWDPVPGARMPTGQVIQTPIAHWPARAMAMVDALQEHANDMRGALVQAVIDEAKRLPVVVRETADEVIDTVTDVASSAGRTAAIVVGVAVGSVVIIGATIAIARTR